MKANRFLFIISAIIYIALFVNPAIGSNPVISNENGEYPISKFSLSVNPLGFIQFGPLINVEFGINSNLVFNTHVRIPSAGVVSYIVHEVGDDDSMSGFAVGGGLIYFAGSKQSKPYIGFLAEYDRTNKVFDVGEDWETAEKDNIGVFLFNAGYRFRFENGFYINTGAFLGTAFSSWESKYTNSSYYVYGPRVKSGTDMVPFGMLEMTIGIEF